MEDGGVVVRLHAPAAAADGELGETCIPAPRPTPQPPPTPLIKPTCSRLRQVYSFMLSRWTRMATSMPLSAAYLMQLGGGVA